VINPKEIRKAKNRIRKTILLSTEQPRVRMSSKTGGIYKFKHYICEVPFETRTDKVGRIYVKFKE